MDKENLISSGSGRKFDPIYNGNKRMSRVNQAISELDRKQQVIIVYEYIDRKPMKIISQELEITQREYMELMKDAFLRIAQRLNVDMG